MTFDDVQFFLLVLFLLTVIIFIVTAVLFGVINGDFHRWSLVDKRQRRNLGDIYEKFIEFIATWKPDV